MKKSVASSVRKKRQSSFHKYVTALALLMLVSACITPHYILDRNSYSLQKEIKNKRAGNVFGDVFLTMGSTLLALITGVYIGYAPGERSLKKVALKNVSEDSLQVNMLTDMIWKDSTYADVMNIRIPPGETCRLLIPSGAVYNLYFSSTFDTTDDDEFLVFDTSTMKKVTLYPGLTFLKEEAPADSTQIHAK